jgi:hypothetical protein
MGRFTPSSPSGMLLLAKFTSISTLRSDVGARRASTHRTTVIDVPLAGRRIHAQTIVTPPPTKASQQLGVRVGAGVSDFASVEANPTGG